MSECYTKEEIDKKLQQADYVQSQIIELTKKEFEDIKQNMLKLNERVKSLEAVIQKIKNSN